MASQSFLQRFKGMKSGISDKFVRLLKIDVSVAVIVLSAEQTVFPAQNPEAMLHIVICKTNSNFGRLPIVAYNWAGYYLLRCSRK